METSRKVKPEITSVIVGCNPRYEIEIMIIQALEEESQLRYTDLREKINSRCQNLGLKKPSIDAFYSRLNNLYKRDVLQKDKDKYGGTHYSLRNNHYKSYLEGMSFLRKYRLLEIK